MGAIFIEFVPNLADKVSKAAPGAVYGVILIAMLFLMPMGAGGFLPGLWRKHVGSKMAAVGEARPAAVGHDVGVDLTGTLSPKDGVRVGAGEPVKR